MSFVDCSECGRQTFVLVLRLSNSDPSPTPVCGSCRRRRNGLTTSADRSPRRLDVSCAAERKGKRKR